MENKLGVGVVGLGMGAYHCKEMQNSGVAKLVAVADISEERGKKAEQEFGVKWYGNYKKMLKRDDIDIVYVCTPSGMHADMGLLAAKAGKNVLIEKPIDVNLKKIDKLIAEADNRNVKVGVSFQRRFYAENKKIKKVIDDGTMGKVHLGEARLKWYRTQQYYEDGGWRGTWKMDGGGALMNQTVHPIDVLLWIMGDVSTVIGKIGTLTHTIETEDTGLAILEFKNGGLGTILGTTTAYPGLDCTLELHSKNASIITLNEKITKWEFESGLKPEDVVVPEFPVTPLEDIVDAIRNNRKPVVDGVEGRKSVEVILSIYKSSMKGSKPVKLL